MNKKYLIIIVNDNSPNFESEEIYKDKAIKGEILKIRNIVKIFKDGKKANDGINLNLYKDEIFALLGQNGAGKTTLISILTGIYQAISGSAIYNGINILESLNMDLFREKLGICPQYDILFDNLNSREHLEMFSIFKVVDSNNINSKINKILKDFNLEDIQYIIAKNLSAGQRRKLSIAMAIVGGSEIIFLNEPSSGMDITSRRELWEILKFQCKGKIIILTTHYMEEVSVLGKRIGIINLGKMKCLGSPLFLIEKFGKYMNLNIIKEKETNDNKIVEFIKSFSSDIKYEILSDEITFRINIREGSEQKKENEDKISLSKFFKSFEENLKIFKTKSYSVLMPTIEDVFLNVSSNSFKKSKKQIKRDLLKRLNNNNILFSTHLKEEFSPKQKFINDFTINMKRRFLITFRDIKGLIMEILCPIILILIGLGISKTEMNFKSYPSKVDIQITGKQKIMLASLKNNEVYQYFSNYYIYNSNITFEKFDEFDYFKFNNNQNDKSKAIEYFVDLNYYKTRDNEESIKKDIDITSNKYFGNYASLLIFEEDNNIYEFIILLNTRVKHSMPIYSQFLINLIINKSVKQKYRY